MDIDLKEEVDSCPFVTTFKQKADRVGSFFPQVKEGVQWKFTEREVSDQATSRRV
jgi:hypothetical protein